MNKNIRRVGKFRFSARLIEDTDYDILVEIMSNFVIIKCEYIYQSFRDFEYTAISHLFDEVEEGMEYPEYTILITREGKRRSVSVHRK